MTDKKRIVMIGKKDRTSILIEDTNNNFSCLLQSFEDYKILLIIDNNCDDYATVTHIKKEINNDHFINELKESLFSNSNNIEDLLELISDYLFDNNLILL
ncbi:MAG: hypothetical protein JRE40_00225 [Deltaproteobacteria bacterium]|nr:hypothetical protein [Deltaproteobacteria bacterium]